MKKKWKNMKTGGRTPKGLQEMLENVFGNAQPGKASLPKSEPVKASKSVKTDAVEPVKAKGFLPTKSQSREEVEPAKAVEALVIQKVRIQSSEDEAACSEIDAITVSSVVSASCSQLEKAKETKSNKGLKRPSKAVPNKKPALAGNSQKKACPSWQQLRATSGQNPSLVGKPKLWLDEGGICQSERVYCHKA